LTAFQSYFIGPLSGNLCKMTIDSPTSPQTLCYTTLRNIGRRLVMLQGKISDYHFQSNLALSKPVKEC